MRTTIGSATALLIAALLAPAAAAAQQASPALTHIGHVAQAFADTPEGAGLLQVALREARTAAEHAGFAARTPTNLAAMKNHAAHVAHAIDPTETTLGPGTGYGLKKAASSVAAHIEMAGRAEGATELMKQHAPHVAAAARTTVERADRALALAKQIREAETDEVAAPLVTQLAELTAQILTGVDANGDGRIDWRAPEGGLETAEQHLAFMTGG
jgi:hypothetical protein